MCIVDDLYEEVAKAAEMSVSQLRKRLTMGEPWIQKYYEMKYDWNPKDDSTIMF